MNDAQFIGNDHLDGLFEATVQATEEAIVNAMVAARDMRGEGGRYANAIDHDALVRLLKQYGRYHPETEMTRASCSPPCCWRSPRRAAFAQTVVVHAGRMVDVDRGEVLTDRAITIENGRVVRVEAWTRRARARREGRRLVALHRAARPDGHAHASRPTKRSPPIRARRSRARRHATPSSARKMRTISACRIHHCARRSASYRGFQPPLPSRLRSMPAKFLARACSWPGPTSP
jgi:hypothetical protein